MFSSNLRISVRVIFRVKIRVTDKDRFSVRG